MSLNPASKRAAARLCGRTTWLPVTSLSPRTTLSMSRQPGILYGSLVPIAISTACVFTSIASTHLELCSTSPGGARAMKTDDQQFQHGGSPNATRCPTVTAVWQQPYLAVNFSSPGEQSNFCGLEDGIVVRRADGSFSMISAEIYAKPRVIAMRLGVYRSSDGLHWVRQRSLRTSLQNATNSPTNVNGTAFGVHASTWGDMFVLDPANHTWLLSYVGYASGHGDPNYQGTVFARYAAVAGDAGLDSDFGEQNHGDPFAPTTRTVFAEDRVLLAPDDYPHWWNHSAHDPWPHRCQGIQGTDSFYPYQLADGTWAAFVGAGVMTSQARAAHDPGWEGHGPNEWQVSLATAPKIAGPWMRFNPDNRSHPADAPCVDLNGGRTENPIVARRPDGPAGFHVVFDAIRNESVGFGYSCSDDGIHWNNDSVVVALEGGARTPYGLLPLTTDEMAEHKTKILSYGVLPPERFGAANTSLQWAFYTAETTSGPCWGKWESFRVAIVQLAW